MRRLAFAKTQEYRLNMVARGGAGAGGGGLAEKRTRDLILFIDHSSPSDDGSFPFLFGFSSPQLNVRKI
jgi:hypothetical protein